MLLAFADVELDLDRLELRRDDEESAGRGLSILQSLDAAGTLHRLGRS